MIKAPNFSLTVEDQLQIFNSIMIFVGNILLFFWEAFCKVLLFIRR